MKNSFAKPKQINPGAFCSSRSYGPLFRTLFVRLIVPALAVLFSGHLQAGDPAQQDTPIRVGVTAGLSDQTLVSFIRAQPGMDATLISRPMPRLLQRMDVLLVTQSRSPGLLVTASLAIRQWVDAGNGVLFFHDAVGYRDHDPIFPEIGAGTHFERNNRLRPARTHLLTRGLDPETYFTPRFQFDHIAIEPGPDGESILMNPEGGVGLVAGSWGQGRVILNGMLTGAATSPDGIGAPTPVEPDGAERQILLNAIRWLVKEK